MQVNELVAGGVETTVIFSYHRYAWNMKIPPKIVDLCKANTLAYRIQVKCKYTYIFICSINKHIYEL